MILLPTGVEGVNTQEHRKSFRNMFQASEDKAIRELSDYFLGSSGFTPLKTTMSNKFAKKIHELVVQYYHGKKENIKRKQKNLLTGQIVHVRYLMKMALFSLITS